jgi:hypothetical protein
MRLGLSYKISVAGTLPISSSQRARAPAWAGGKPANMKRSEGRPEMLSAMIAAEGPGAAVTGRPASITARAS